MIVIVRSSRGGDGCFFALAAFGFGEVVLDFELCCGCSSGCHEMKGAKTKVMGLSF